MEQLYLLRHGIATPHGTPGLADDDRPLTPEGEKKVRQVAEGLRNLDLNLDRIVSSPLPRALKTAEIVADVLGLTDALETTDSLRANRNAAAIRDWLRTRTENRLMLVGHNPSLSDLIGLMITETDVSLPIDLRKGGVAALVGDVGTRMKLDWLARPRLLRNLREC